jgi:hypothetical protein
MESTAQFKSKHCKRGLTVGTLGVCRARPKQYEFLDTLQGKFYKPEAPPPKSSSPIPGLTRQLILSGAGKISRDGERRPSYLPPDSRETSFSTKSHSSKVEPLPRNLPCSDTRALTLPWAGKEKIIFGMLTS